jgi:hypothetical protein
MLDFRLWKIRYKQLRVTCKQYMKINTTSVKQPAHKRVKYINMNIQQIKIPRPLVAHPDSRGTTPT